MTITRHKNKRCGLIRKKHHEYLALTSEESRRREIGKVIEDHFKSEIYRRTELLWLLRFSRQMLYGIEKGNTPIPLSKVMLVYAFFNYDERLLPEILRPDYFKIIRIDENMVEKEYLYDENGELIDNEKENTIGSTRTNSFCKMV